MENTQILEQKRRCAAEGTSWQTHLWNSSQDAKTGDLRALPEKCEHVQEEAGAKASKFFLLQTLCPSPDSNEEQLVLQSCRYFHVQGRNLAPTSVAACDEKLTLSSGVWGREEKWLAQQ